MEKTQWKISIDLQELTVNSEHIPGMYRWHVCVRNAEGRLLLKGEDIPVQEGDVKWVKFSALHPNPENGFHEGNFVASAIAVNEEGFTIAENDSEAFFLTEEQIQFIKDTNAASHPKVPSGEQSVTSTVIAISETTAIEPERPPGGDLGIHIPKPVASPLSPHVEEVQGGVGGETGEARNIQASPETTPAPTHTNPESEETKLTDATPATETPATVQPPIPPATIVPTPATPSPQKVATYAVEQMQKQLAEKEKQHAEELAHFQQKTAEDVERLRQENNENTERLKRERVEQEQRQAEALRRANEQAEQKLAEERAAHQHVERAQRQRQEQEQVANAERQRLHEEQMTTLRQQIAALANAQQAQAANPAPAAAATQTTTATTPQPAPAANQTQPPPTAAAGAAPHTEEDPDDEPTEVRHTGRFVWRASHSATLVIILLAIVAAALILWNNSVPSSEKLADTGDKAELIRLQEEMNQAKIKDVAGSQKPATPVVPTPVTLETEGKTLDNKHVDPYSAPSSIRDGARASVNMLNNSSFGDNARIEVNNKINIHDNRQDNRKTIVHPNGWPLDWRPTLPTVVVSDIQCGIHDIILPPRGVQCFELAHGWRVEVAREDMPLLDAKYGNDDHCFDYTLGKPGNRLYGNQVRIRPKAHQYKDVTVTVSIKHADCTHPPGPHR